MWRAFGPIAQAGAGLRSPQQALEPRPRLEARISEALRGRLSIVVAAAGYGKSTALMRSARLDPRPALWFWCAPDDTGVTLARHLAGAVAGPFAVELEETSPDWGSALRAVLLTVNQPHLLLIDDVDRLPPADLQRLLELTAGELQPGWHAVLTSRRELAIPRLDGLLQAGDAQRLDELDLALDPDEARAVSAEVGGDQSDWVRLHEETQGWPMGLVHRLDAEGLGHFFWREVIEQQPVSVRSFLEETAVLETLSPLACRAVSGRRNAGSLLDHIVAAHLFVLRGSNGLAYQPQFKGALLRLARERQPRRLARSYMRAAEHYIEYGDILSAMRVVAAGAEWTPLPPARAIELLRWAAPRAIAAGHGSDLLAWLASFPPEVARHDPWALHYRGVALRLTTEEYDVAWRLQEQARDAFAAAGEARGRIFAVAELGTLACLLKRPTEAEGLLEEARIGLAGGDSHLHASVLCALADAYVSLNRLREATLAGEEALAVAADDHGPESNVTAQVQALYRLAHVTLREGHLAKVLEIGARAHDLGREHPLDAESGALGAFTLALGHWANGDLDVALELLSSAAEQAANHGLSGLARGIQASMAEVLAGLERFDEADALFRAIGNPSMFPGDVGMLRYLQDQSVDALAIFRRGLEQASQAGSAADVGRAKAALGAVCLRMDRLVEAEQWLLDAARSFEQSGARSRLAGAHLQLAHLHFVIGNLARSNHFLGLALDYSSTVGTHSFFLWHPAIVATMAAQALVHGIQPEYVEALCCRRLRAAQVRAFLPLLSRPEPAIRERAMRIMRALLERGGEPLALAELDECRDEAARARLTSAVAAERLTSHGLLELRHHRGLTWAELDAFVAYYLADPQTLVESNEPERHALAQRLHVSENTLMHHITSIRRKLGFGARRGPAAVFLWALLSDISRLKVQPGAPTSSLSLRSGQPAPEPGTHHRN
jgi:ATP/maltotriose-dependent transcriptional regulator MalT